MEQEISKAMVAISMANESMIDFVKIKEWFENKGYAVGDESIVSKNYNILYTYFNKLNILTFYYEGNVDENFPNIIFEFISNLQDLKKTNISIAEEQGMGFQTLIDLPLGKFIKTVLNGD
jgi:hypothetical protein